MGSSLKYFMKRYPRYLDSIWRKNIIILTIKKAVRDVEEHGPRVDLALVLMAGMVYGN